MYVHMKFISILIFTPTTITSSSLEIVNISCYLSELLCYSSLFLFLIFMYKNDKKVKCSSNIRTNIWEQFLPLMISKTSSCYHG